MAELQIRAILKDEFSAAAQKLIRELGQIGAQGSAAGAAMRSSMSSALPTVEAVNESLGRNVAQLRAQAVAYKSPEGARYLSEQKRLREEIDRLTGSMKEQEPAIQKTGIQWTDLTAKYFMVSQGIQMVGGAIGSLVENSAKWESTRKSLEAIEGSAEAASNTIDRLVKEAAAPGLDLMPLQKGYLGFRAMNFEGDRAIHIMKSFGNAIALAGGGGEQFASVNRQILQMLGKGRVLQEDISIIAESLPRIRTLMLDAFGTGSVEAIRESGVSAEEFVNRIVEAADKLPPALDTINNQLDNSATAWSQFKAAIVPDGMIKGSLEGWTNELQALTAIITGVTHPLKTARDLLRDVRAEIDKRGDVSNAQLRRAKEIEQTTGIKADFTLYGSGMMSGQGAAQSFAAAQEKAVKATEAQEKALAAAKKQLGKTSLDVAIQNVRDEWGARLREFKAGSEEYKTLLAAQLQAEADIRKSFAKKGAPSSADRSFERAASLNVIGGQLSDNIGVAGQNVAIKLDEMRRKDVDKALADEQKRKADGIKEREKENEALIRESKDIEKQITDFDRKEAERRRKIWEDEWQRRSNLARNYADTLSSTMASAYTDMWVNGRNAFDSIYDAFSEMITKMAIEMAAKATIFAAFSAFGGGGLLGGASSFIFGARATGGVTLPGVRYRVNEDGYNGGGGEMFRSSSAGTISPNRGGGGGGGGNVQHFHFAAGTSRADRGAIIRSIKIATKSRENSVARGI